MRLLAVNTAGTSTEVALIDGSKIYSFRDDQYRHASAELLPAVDRLLAEAGMTLDDMDGFGVCIGPGSFTGIRIGLATVRAFCYATDRRAVAVNTGEVLAYNTTTDAESIVSLWDAGNGYAYAAAYEGGTMRELLPPKCLTIPEAEAFLKTVDEPFVVSTDTVMQSYGTVGKDFGLAAAVCRRAKSNDWLSYNALLPLYVRISQAEQNAHN